MANPWSRDEGRTRVMGILNVTPDSFSGDGLAGDLEAAAARADRFAAEGADILDVGGESTRPGHRPVAGRAEVDRLLPALRAIRTVTDLPISVDTRKAEVAEAALRAGASIVNDVSGLTDPDMAAVVARHRAGLVLVHNGPVDPRDPMDTVLSDLRGSLRIAIAAGITKERIAVDPGLGFGKEWQVNLRLLGSLRRLCVLGRPILVGPSRKGTIGRVLGVGVEDRQEGTAALVAIAVAEGADVVRVHDVREMAQVVAMMDAIVRR